MRGKEMEWIDNYHGDTEVGVQKETGLKSYDLWMRTMVGKG